MLFMHCGWVRTGTTSLQAALVAHQGQLRAAGIVYPDLWRLDGEDNHHGLVRLLQEKRNRRPGLERFQDDLRRLRGQTVLLSSECLTYWAVDGKRDALLDLLAAAGEEMPVTSIWTLRSVLDVATSLYVRHILIYRATPFPPAEIIDRVIAGASWPESTFAGLQRLEAAVEHTAYLKYQRDGSHCHELLGVAAVPPALAAAIEERLDLGPRLNTRLSQKGVVAILHRDRLSDRAGFPIDNAKLARLLHHGDFRFDGDGPCNPFDENAIGKLHEGALAAARSCGFQPYLDFFENEELAAPSSVELDPDAISDEDLGRLVERLEGMDAAPARVAS